MAAQTFGSTSTTTALAPRVNLLPPEIAERTKVRKAQMAMMCTGLAAVAVVGVMYVNAKAGVADANEARTAAEARNARLTTELRKLDGVKSTYAQVDAANKTLAIAMHDEIRWSTYLHDLTLKIPSNVWLEEMSLKMTTTKQAGGGNEPVLDPGIGTVTFKGVAFSHDDVAAWLESLATQKGYTDPYFTKSEDKMLGRVIVDFESTVYLSEKALAKRYAKGLDR